ncbi:hypothetical protein ACFLVW_07405 [Chloroflexota bacterium]
MESQDKEKEYEHNVWEIYRKEWETASPEKRIELNKRMRCWQELMKSGLTAQQAYYKAMEGELDKPPIYKAIEEESDYGVVEEHSNKPPGYSFWSWMPKAVFFILGLALVTVVVFCIVINGKVNTLNTELESVKNALTSTQAELSSTKQTLVSMQSELSSTKGMLTSTQAELSSTKQTLASTQVDLSATKQLLASTESELGSTKQSLTITQSQLSSTKQSLTLKQGELDKAEAKIILFQETFGADVFSDMQPPVTGGGFVGSPNIHNNPTAINPSWGQLITFLRNDPADDRYYSEGFFNCVSFAEMLHNNAEDAGIKAAFVAVRFKNETIGHALNAFKTTNKGLVYVDCTGVTAGQAFEDEFNERFYGFTIELDTIAYVKKGSKYGQLSIEDPFISPKYEYYLANYNVAKKVLKYWWVPEDVVEGIEIYW